MSLDLQVTVVTLLTVMLVCSVFVGIATQSFYALVHVFIYGYVLAVSVLIWIVVAFGVTVTTIHLPHSYSFIL